MKKGPERIDIIEAIKTLRKKKDVKLFRKIVKEFKSSARARPEVNLSKIDKNSKANSTVVVSGKVLGGGVLNHPVNIVALSFSESAERKIKNSGGKCRDFSWLVEKGAKDVILLK